MEDDNKFLELFKLDVNDKTEKKKTGSTELTYLSWAFAWSEFVKVYPNAIYEIVKNENGLPYFHDDSGAMVYTKVKAGGLTHEMWLPVMDGANNAMKNKPYTYQVKEYNYGKPTGKMIDKTVNAYTMFDINKTVMRCLVKNLAMFGLGLYIYAGEDLPEGDEHITQSTIQQKAPAPSKANDDDKKKLWASFTAKLKSFNIEPKDFLARDNVDIKDPDATYSTVRKYMNLSDEMFIGVLENWEA